MNKTLVVATIIALLCACAPRETGDNEEMERMEALLAKYAPVEVTTDVPGLTDIQKQVLDKLVEASHIIDEIYWQQASADGVKLREELEKTSDMPLDAAKLRFLEINKCAYDRLDGDKPFLDVKPLPEGATFWPEDLTREELEAYVAAHPDEKEALFSLTTIVRREGNKLVAIPYHEHFKGLLQRASELLQEAAALTDNESLENYLELRAEALVTDNFFESDMAWMDLQGNTLDIVIGPIEVYDDRLMNLKAAYEAYVLVKDEEASRELASYIDSMQAMQANLPVEERYKQRQVQLGSSVGVFTEVFGAGQCEAGSKTIAISLPNDPRVRTEKGARKVMLRNAIAAKFDKILMPIAGRMIVPDQLEEVNGDLFFSNVLLHEISHSLGNDYVLDENGNQTAETIDEALKERTSAIEECKADIGGLYSMDTMIDKGLMSEEDRLRAYVTFTAGIFRSVRFGATSAHGIANAIAFNWLKETGGVVVDEAGRYSVDADAFHAGLEGLLTELLTIQYTGDYQRAVALIDQYGSLPAVISEKLEEMDDIPVDIEFIWH